MLSIISIKIKSSKCLVTFDNGEIIELFTDVVLKYKLSVSMQFNDELFEQLISENNLMKAKREMYAFASYTMRTEKQIIDKMKLKGYNEDIISKVITFLKDFGLIDDNKFAVSYVNTKLKAKAPSINKLKMELISKGISKSIAENALEANYPHETKFEIALKAAQKKHRMIQNKPKEKHKQMIINNLLGQGFDWEEISKVVSELKL